MAEENGAAPQPPTPPRMQILGQFIRDLSFENIAAQKSIQTQTQPDIQVQVALDARKREQENQFDVIVKLKIESKTKDETPQPIFLIELDYVGIFQVENVPQEQLHPFLMIECPRMLFPFLRRIVSDITRDGGFPPLNLENMDFLAIYRNELARRAESKKTADA
ncbi:MULTISPECIES: protein-export chaperone SecB [Paracoccaceae]|jgi:preprotein translocase subunit SecB|uniref:Protein-export protein SecB n=1 Tax=Rhodophyticola porphyridii TaxID=1852017 RepID=A0A3L9Y996_9RHOB|nr:MULTISPECIES: protein-export chaperone SecB [Paracoccaceae]MBO6601722.1 protein-export chaperone SecB [Roseicyclus sp.]MBO6625665.1 protein-export chaperone SecB [Roseicyclus sp.]MBO6920891.1 protein-export chaperone SecB [Roseicyclus sp.]RMA42803.1 protein-export chaperone SecB [Rhodophyticola porphyridii]